MTQQHDSDCSSRGEVNPGADAAVKGRLADSAELACSEYRLRPTDAADRVQFTEQSTLLALCPFCGSDRVEVRLYNQPSVVCHSCLCMGPAARRLTLHPDNKLEAAEEARKLWNRRAELKAKAE